MRALYLTAISNLIPEQACSPNIYSNHYHPVSVMIQHSMIVGQHTCLDGNYLNSLQICSPLMSASSSTIPANSSTANCVVLTITALCGSAGSKHHLVNRVHVTCAASIAPSPA